MMLTLFWWTFFDELLADAAEAYWAAEYRLIVAGMA
jgi:hypothetical protein